MTQPAIAAAMGVSLSTVNRAHIDFDHGGIKALKPKPSGGRLRENMTLAEETTLLAPPPEPLSNHRWGTVSTSRVVMVARTD